MITFPTEAKFKYKWRKYQQKVLDGLTDYLKDGHLHVIAPPGSGKTVLGLEVALRLNQPTLILAPTIAIRNQWIQRFCALFLQTDITPDWISRDIRNPAFLTVVTYQGLHAACSNLRIVAEDLLMEEDALVEEEPVSPKDSTRKNVLTVIAGLKAQGVKTIVVDEAHHLKNEWWQTLTRVKKALNPVIVGLTATPPYDVSANEWQRYLELNGPVDIEIAVPELVIEGDLCPHQDYVYFTLPTPAENQGINEFRTRIEQLFQEIREDKTLVAAIAAHPVWVYPLSNLDWIYNNLPFYSAAMIFLHANGIEVTEDHLEVIGDQKLKIPAFDYSWVETLLDFYLFKAPEYFKAYEEHRKHLENKLRRGGAIERRQINFSQNKRVTGFLTSSMSKLNGIKHIVDFEHDQLGAQLRMVILSDYIRKEFYVSTAENTLDLNKMGVIPIFEKLRRENTAAVKIGVLTGAMVIIPKSAYPAFEKKTIASGIENIGFSPVPYDEDYLLIRQTDQLKNDVVHLVTQIFQEGEIEVLMGTKSLLGEGWDAPAINALVLASFVGSFVLSNQMRGRAIRAQNGNADKTGNIWHLVCIDPTVRTGGEDYDLLKRRFKSFVGVSFKDEPGIENGAGRLNIPVDIHLKTVADQKNQETLKYAGDRKSLQQRWKTALDSGRVLIEEIKIPFAEERPFREIKKMYLDKTIAYLAATLGAGALAFLGELPVMLMRGARNIHSMSQFMTLLAIFAGIGVLVLGGRAYKTFRLYLKYRDISKDIQQIGEALLNTLIWTGTLQTAASQLSAQATVDDSGAVYCHLEGGTTFEKSAFINCLKEIIAPIDNPKYVVIRKSVFMFFVEQRDFHSIPEMIGKKKNQAEYFRKEWELRVGPCDLVYTRTLEGRKLLLKSRIHSLAAQFDDRVEHVNKWR